MHPDNAIFNMIKYKKKMYSEKDTIRAEIEKQNTLNSKDKAILQVFL